MTYSKIPDLRFRDFLFLAKRPYGYILIINDMVFLVLILSANGIVLLRIKYEMIF